MKLFLLFLVLATGLCFAQAENFVWGIQGPDDELLDSRYVWRIAVPSMARKAVERFPHGYKYNVPITCIEVIDRINNGADRNAQILSGGIGQNFVELRFYSGRFRSFEYDVLVYGKKK